jgi:hypothetical protein
MTDDAQTLIFICETMAIGGEAPCSSTGSTGSNNNRPDQTISG